MKTTIRTTDVDRYFWEVRNLQLIGYTIVEQKTYWQWSVWRYVRIYHASMEMRVNARFDFGPVSERPLPPVPEE